MTFMFCNFRRRVVRNMAFVALASVIPLGVFDACDQQLANISSYVDPCGTILANCTPGTFQVRAANPGDYCIDPACTVPGQCGGGQPLGTITRICP